MSSRNQRIVTGINSLVVRLLPEIPPKDGIASEDRVKEATDFVRGYLEK